ncbi:MAG: UDP-glucose/GDP-mannose dehydrogenase family protein, partial [Nostoc sp.]
MKISIFGLGYVGVVTAACLARDGHEVIGVDVNPEKVDLIAKGESPIVEPGLSQLLVEGVAAKLIRATTDAEAAVLASDISLISVGTPPIERGEPDLTYVWNVCKQI